MRDIIHDDYGDDEFEAFARKFSGKGDYEKAHSKYRFLKSGYLKSASKSYQQNVVIKIINKGQGQGHLKTLLDYISRQDENEKETELFNENDEIVSKEDFENLIKEWGQSFEQWDVSEKTKEAINFITQQEAILSDHHYSKGLDPEQRRLFLKVKTYNQTFEIDKGFYEGAFVRDKEKDILGFLTKKENEFFIESISPEGTVSSSKTSKDNLEPIGKEIKKDMKSKPKDFSHMIFSTGGDNPDKKLAMTATQDFLRENFKSKGFQYAYVMHDDTKNLHFHVVIKNRSLAYHNNKGRHSLSLDLNKFDLQILRERYTRKLDGFGINRDAVLKKDKKDYLEDALKQARQSRFDKSWFDFQLSRTDTPRFDALKFRRRALMQLDTMADVYKKRGRDDLSEMLKSEKKRYAKIEPEQIKKAIDSTVSVLQKDKEQIGKTMEQSFLKEIGSPKDYQAPDKDVDKVLNDYREHLEKTEDDLKSLRDNKISPVLAERRDQALEFIEERKIQLEQEAIKGRTLEKPNK